MGRRREKSRRSKTCSGPDRDDPVPATRFHTPFADLPRLSRRVAAERGKARTVPKPSPPASTSLPAAREASRKDGRDDGREAELLAEAMRGVVPLPGRDRKRIDGPAPAGLKPRAPVSEEAEALAVLADLVAGNGHFDLSDTDEYVEGRVTGLDPRLVRRLRRGDFAHQAHLDLHRLTAEEARVEVERFLTAAHQKGRRCVLIIHGRGRNSKDQVPVLKERLKTWLGRTALSRLVLAFTTARPCDGGPGAVYVLLRRQRRARRPFVVTDGAKR